MVEQDPVHLVEDVRSGARFLIYSGERGPSVELRYEGEALWMTQAQMAALFGVTVASISRHILNIVEDSELEAEATVTKIAIVRMEGDRRVARQLEHYSLDMVISIGYRVSSAQATLFRRWATDKLVQFATKGFVIDSAKLKQPEMQDRVAELRDIIRDIRSDEANLYREWRKICSLCQDYDPKSEEWTTFYRNTQAKLIYAVTSKTPAEVVQNRSNAGDEHMGLQTWLKGEIRKADVTISKNYLGPAKVKELNRLTTIILDIFEDQLDIGRLTRMAEAEALLDSQLKNLGRSLLQSGGSIRKADADTHAKQEYARYQTKLKKLRHAEADQVIRDLKAVQKFLPRKVKPRRST
jgi:hypothetical protein